METVAEFRVRVRSLMELQSPKSSTCFQPPICGQCSGQGRWLPGGRALQGGTGDPAAVIRPDGVSVDQWIIAASGPAHILAVGGGERVFGISAARSPEAHGTGRRVADFRTRCRRRRRGSRPARFIRCATRERTPRGLVPDISHGGVSWLVRWRCKVATRARPTSPLSAVLPQRQDTGRSRKTRGASLARSRRRKPLATPSFPMATRNPIRRGVPRSGRKDRGFQAGPGDLVTAFAEGSSTSATPPQARRSRNSSGVRHGRGPHAERGHDRGNAPGRAGRGCR